MRNIAPILLGLLLSLAAFADDDTPAPAAPSGGGVSQPDNPTSGHQNDLVSWCNKNLSNQSAICTAAGSHVCSLDEQSSGCEKPTLPKPVKIDWGTTIDDNSLPAKSSDVEKTGEALKSMAQNCCSGSGSGCQLPADAATAQQNLKTAADDKQKVLDDSQDGALSSAKATSGLNSNGVAVASGLAQMCEAAVFNCMQWANKTATDFAAANKSTCNSCDAAEGLIKGYLSDCSKALTTSTVFGNLASGQGAQKKIDDATSKMSSGTPASGTPASGTPSKGSGAGGGDSGGGDMSSMMKGLAQAAQAYMQMQQQQQTTPTTPTTPAATACTAASVGGTCPAAAATSAPAWNNGQATLSQTGSGTPSGTSNVANLNDQLAGAGPAPIPFTQLTPLSSGTVPGGGGGGSGLGGSTPGGATLGGGVPANYARGGSGVDTNIMHGEGGGGFSQVAAAMNTSTGGGGGGWGGYGREPASNNFDLKSFLPGGRNDPSRGLAGGNVKGAQIQSSKVNIWSRISDHIKARCSQGLLRDCVP